MAVVVNHLPGQHDQQTHDPTKGKRKRVVSYLLKGDIIEKGGPGSGHFDHEGRPGKVGGSKPSKSDIADNIKQKKYKKVGPLGNQGKQSKTSLLELNDGTKVVRKRYKKDYKDMSKNDVACYDIAQELGFDRVPVTVMDDKGVMYQEFVSDAESFAEYQRKSYLEYIDNLPEGVERPDDIEIRYGMVEGYKPDNIIVEQLKDLVLFDVLIGNQDRHNENLLVDSETKILSWIDNSYSLQRSIVRESITLGRKYHQYRGQTIPIIGHINTHFLPHGYNILDNLTVSEWKSFNKKARRSRVKNIIIGHYGDVDGGDIWDDVIGRLDAFDEFFSSYTKRKREKGVNIITKGGPGSGYHNHPGRPGKVGGSLPRGAAAYSNFVDRIKNEDYKYKGKLGKQGGQAFTSLVILEGGTPVIRKDYKAAYHSMGKNDTAAYGIAQILGYEEVPMTTDDGSSISFQRFVNNSSTWGSMQNRNRKMSDEDAEKLLYFDILIGNGDRHSGNIMVNNKTGKISWIDNSTTLADAYMGVWAIQQPEYDKFTATMINRVEWFTRREAYTPKFSIDRWNDFSTKARSARMKSFIRQVYGDELGGDVWTAMMGRLESFERTAFEQKHLPGQHDQSTHGNRYGPKTRQEVIESLGRYGTYVTTDPYDYDEPPKGRFDKTYWERFDKSGPTLVYHGTRSDVVKLIKAYGLKKGGPWMDRPPSVYFTTDPIEARSWMFQALIEFVIPDEWDDEIVTDAIAMRDFNWKAAFRIERDIPPEYIRSIKVYNVGTSKLDEIYSSKERIAYTIIECHFTDDEPKHKRVVKHLQGYHDQQTHDPTKGKRKRVVTRLKPKFEQQSSKLFVRQLNENLAEKYKSFVTTYSASQYDEMGAKCFISNTGQSGYALKPDGDIISVFSKSGSGEGKRALISAIVNGGTKLDCFDGFLPEFYSQFGFIETGRLTWDDEYMPSGWDKDKFNSPDVVLMSLRAFGKASKSEKDKLERLERAQREYVDDVFGGELTQEEQEEIAKIVNNKVEKGGPGSGHWGHAGRPGEVGGSLPKGSALAYINFEHRAILGLYEDKGLLGEQGYQGQTYLIELEGGTPAILKRYPLYEYPGMALNDEAAYKISQVLGMDNVPMTVSIDKQNSVQRFVSDSVTWMDYFGSDPDPDKFVEPMLFDVLIGNADRHGHNWMVNETTGKITLIDNGFSLASAYRGFENEIDFVADIVDEYSYSPIKYLDWDTFDNFKYKAWNDEMENAVKSVYGDYLGGKVYGDMLRRLDTFEDMYGGELKERRIVIVKGGPGSGHFDHAGRPGKVGGSMPKGEPEVYKPEIIMNVDTFEDMVENDRWVAEKLLNKQGSQANTYLARMGNGQAAIYKEYKQDEGMGKTDEICYKLAQTLGMDNVPVAISITRNESIQEFIDNATTWWDYPDKEMLTEEQFDEVMLFDVLIGNTDRNGGNLLIHKETGWVYLIDNSYTLANSYMSYERYELGTMRDWVKGWVVEIVDWTEGLIAGHPMNSLTRAEWNDFSSKARSDEVRGIIIDGYGDVKGARVHAEMMERLDIFEDKYGRYIK
jgi:hypothetical protein